MTQELSSLFEEIFSQRKLVKMIFSAKRKKSLSCHKVIIRPVQIGENFLYQKESLHEKKAFHENLPAASAITETLRLIQEDFKQINIFLEDEHPPPLASKPQNPRIIRKAASKKPADLSHNQSKQYIIPDGLPCDFLIHLGVMDKEGKVYPRYYSKFRQINRYLEIIDDIYPALPADRPVKIIDFGCGKAYLTFAVYYYLKIIRNREADITGLDLKEDVIAFCNETARSLGYDKLTFLRGDIADYTSDHADLVITLHACDTATDYALIHAVAWGTKVILSVPCCQHELFNQIHNHLHEPLLKHGILKDRLTEYLTDGLRGLKLEAHGYDVSMIEFTSLEHTAKNIMIKAIKNTSPDTAKAMRAEQQYQELCDFYQIHPTIGKL